MGMFLQQDDWHICDMSTVLQIKEIIKTAHNNGEILNTEDLRQILNSLKPIAKKREALDHLINLLEHLKRRTTHHQQLSKRQQEVLTEIALGRTSNEIATALDISVGTVSTHRKNIIKKLKLSGSGQLQYYATCNAIINVVQRHENPYV